MSSIQGPSTAFRPLPSTTHSGPPPSTVHPTTVTPTVHTPSTTMLHQVQQSQGQSQTLGQLTSPTVVQSGQQQIDSTPAPTVDQSHQEASSIFGQSSLGKKVETLVSVGSTVHSVVDGEVMGVKPSEHFDTLLEAVTTKVTVPVVNTEIRSVESHLLEHFTGIDHETAELGKSIIDTAKTGLQAAHTLQSMQELYQKPSLETTGTALKETYVLLGGDKTIDTISKITTCCQERSLDSTKEMIESIGKLSSDDSYSSQLTHLAVKTGSTYVLGETLTGGLGSLVPGIGLVATAIDTKIAYDKVQEYRSGQGSLLEATKGVITACGTGSGATFAPIVGPVVATTLNLTLDVGSKVVSGISSWWYG